MNNEQNGASAGTIDTPEFRKMIAHVQGFDDGEPIFRSAETALITYIMDWHSAGVAEARQEGCDSQLIRIRHLENERDIAWLGLDSSARQLNEAQAALAAAREQALADVKRLFPQPYMEYFGSTIHEEIDRLASQPATTAQTDEVTDSVDRDAPLRGAPAATDDAVSGGAGE